MSRKLSVVSATPADVPLLHELMGELAEYERLVEYLVTTEADLADALFGPRPAAEALVGYLDGAAVGYAMFFMTYSTFRGRRGIYLEDLFVRTEARGEGMGQALLARLAAIAVERGCARLEWAVLNWNEPAIGFYKRLGAVPMDTWTVYRLTDEPLAALAKKQPSASSE
jgi:GNAT superfamily N-acetyltransferase